MQIQVLPFTAGAHPAQDGSHTIFRFDAGSLVVVVEPMTTSLYLEEVRRRPVRRQLQPPALMGLVENGHLLLGGDPTPAQWISPPSGT
ncbi:Scr1 family TA system antitoxin-like transcriptional regulator [Streptomyces platensis]|uniref:Scr1 family TA system antitoxin-like transcriptional regulator n=1 Tax=Streptomyces platensis TaxID=58346 RepID=UPI0037AF3C33